MIILEDKKNYSIQVLIDNSNHYEGTEYSIEYPEGTFSEIVFDRTNNKNIIESQDKVFISSNPIKIYPCKKILLGIKLKNHENISMRMRFLSKHKRLPRKFKKYLTKRK